jgi:hypothetical protein
MVMADPRLSFLLCGPLLFLLAGCPAAQCDSAQESFLERQECTYRWDFPVDCQATAQRLAGCGCDVIAWGQWYACLEEHAECYGGLPDFGEEECWNLVEAVDRSCGPCE